MEFHFDFNENTYHAIGMSVQFLVSPALGPAVGNQRSRVRPRSMS
jgi:hypothetical protein